MSDAGQLILIHAREFPGNYLLHRESSAVLSPIINKIEPVHVVVGGAWHTCPKSGMRAFLSSTDNYYLRFYHNSTDERTRLGLTTSVPAWCVALLRHWLMWARFGEEGQLADRDFVQVGRDSALLRQGHKYFKQGVALLKEHQGSGERMLAALAEVRLTDEDCDVRHAAQIALEALA